MDPIFVVFADVNLVLVQRRDNVDPWHPFFHHLVEEVKFTLLFQRDGIRDADCVEENMFEAESVDDFLHHIQ